MEKLPIIFKRFGDKAILIEWPAQIDSQLLKLRIAYEKLISEHFSSQFQNTLIDIVPAYHSITLIFQNEIVNWNKIIQYLKTLYSQLNVLPNLNSRVVHIPVCYENSLASDIEEFARLKKISIQGIIDLHTQPLYEVYFFGFLPGFMYLGGLNKKLHHPRKDKPGLTVPKGAVAIGGQQTGIYPINSPGGWHIIGNTPLEIFNPYIDSSSIAVMGDKIKFIAISVQEYSQIQQSVIDGTYQVVYENCHD